MKVVFWVDLPELGLLIRQARNEKNFSLEEVASSLKITPETLRKIETGETQKISIARLSWLDDILETSFAETAHLSLKNTPIELSDE